MDADDISYPRSLGYLFAALGDIETAWKWLIVASAIKPNDENLLHLRSILLGIEMRMDEHAEFTERWRARRPANPLALYNSMWTFLGLAYLAELDGRDEEATRLTRKAVEYANPVLDPARTNGMIRANTRNLFVLELYAIATKRLDLYAQVQTACRAIIEFFERDQTGLSQTMFYQSDLYLSIAYALLDDREQAIEHFKHLSEFKVNEVWQIEMREKAGVFDSIKSDPNYIDTMATLRRSNAETLARLHKEMPQSFARSL